MTSFIDIVFTKKMYKLVKHQYKMFYLIERLFGYEKISQNVRLSKLIRSISYSLPNRQ